MADVKNSTTTISSISKDTTRITIVGFGGSFKISKRHLTYILTILFLVLALLFLFPYTESVQSFNLPKLGEVSKETIVAPITFDILKSEDEIEKEKKEAMEQVLLVFRKDESKSELVRKKLINLKKNITALNLKTTPDSLKEKILSSVRKELSESTVNILSSNLYIIDDLLLKVNSVLDNGILSILLVADKSELSRYSNNYNRNFENYLLYKKKFITLIEDSTELTVGISKIPVKDVAVENIVNSLKSNPVFGAKELSAAYEILSVYLLPNINFDGKETSERQSRAAKQVLPTKGSVIKDSEIIRKHKVVTQDDIDKLYSLHVAIEEEKTGEKAKVVFWSNAGMIFLSILFIAFVMFYVYYFNTALWKNERHFAAIAAIIAIQLLVVRLSGLFIPRFFDTSSDIAFLNNDYIIPIALGSILGTVLFDVGISMIITIFTALYLGMVLSFSYTTLVYVIAGGIVSGFVTTGIRYRWDFFKSIPPVAVAYSIAVILISIASANLDISVIFQNILYSMINVLLSVFMAMMLIPLFENIFAITTNATLLELSDMNHPVLKKLSIEAPGTYNHSVLVANLAESAAERVKANSLLARVASYYHDIGKIVKPIYFVENQKFGRNIHDKLQPNMSARVIAAHVKNGLDMAKKYKLPSVISDAIAQHHGTTLVSFFYDKAKERDVHDLIKKSDFTYMGPKPQTKENAIIMLADSVEAASRSLSESSPKLLRALVRKIIYSKFSSSQLDECDLTFKDLNLIVEGFIPILQGVFHTRIEYPDNSKVE